MHVGSQQLIGVIDEVLQFGCRHGRRGAQAERSRQWPVGNRTTDHQAGGENVQKGGCPCSLPGERVMHIERNIGCVCLRTTWLVPASWQFVRLLFCERQSHRTLRSLYGHYFANVQLVPDHVLSDGIGRHSVRRREILHTRCLLLFEGFLRTLDDVRREDHLSRDDACRLETGFQI